MTANDSSAIVISADMSNKIEQGTSSGALNHKINDGDANSTSNPPDGDANPASNPSSSGDSQAKATKKSTLKWRGSLENEFNKAIEHIDLHKATRMEILEFMNMNFLTRDHIASKLQMSMRRTNTEGKMSLREMSEEEEEDTFEEEEQEALAKKLKGKATSSGVCQVEKCTADMSIVKQYYKRHKVCEFHAKAPVVQISGRHQRFCQQCSRFHGLHEFDEAKRSCRRRLAGNTERRRKRTTE